MSTYGSCLNFSTSRIFLRTVSVTLEPRTIAPVNSAKSARIMACLCVSVLEATAVENEFATSFAPVVRAPLVNACSATGSLGRSRVLFVLSFPFSLSPLCRSHVLNTPMPYESAKATKKAKTTRASYCPATPTFVASTTMNGRQRCNVPRSPVYWRDRLGPSHPFLREIFALEAKTAVGAARGADSGDTPRG